MDLHRRWAARRAWRARVLLAALLAVAAWALRPWLGYAALLLPLLALLYPASREEERALAEIDRRLGLAYRTALETPPDDPAYPRLRRAAAQAAAAARLPRPPWGALALAVLVWLAAAALPPPGGAGFWRESATAVRQDAGPAESPRTADREGGRPLESGDAEPAAEGADDGAAGRAQEAAGQPASEPETGGQGAEAQNADAREAGRSAAAGEGAASGGDLQASGGEEAKSAVAAEEPAGAAAVAGDEGGGADGADGASGGAGSDSGGPESPPLPAARPPQPEAGALPDPWEAGPPPDVRRAAERYIENNPLPPGAAEAIRRYFELDR
ncbi:hypothetical protein [Oceanithermus sp.]